MKTHDLRHLRGLTIIIPPKMYIHGMFTTMLMESMITSCLSSLGCLCCFEAVVIFNDDGHE